MLALVLEASKKLSQNGGSTLRHKVLPLGSLEYKPSDLGPKPPLFRDALGLKA